MASRFSCETYVFGGLKVDNDNLPSFALGEERKVCSWFNLHGRAEGQGQVCPSGCGQQRSES